MQRVNLLDATRAILAQAGFRVSERFDLRPISFDLVARRERELLLLKVLGNVDALSEPIAREIKLLSKFLDAKPLMVGLRSGAGFLEDGVVYARHEIPIITPNTLAAQYLEGNVPLVFAAPGGLYVRVDGSKLRQTRLASGFSLGALAQVAGVSRRAIQMYEEGMNASIDAAMRLEEFFETDLIEEMNPTSLFDTSRYQPEQPQPTQDPWELLAKQFLEGLGYEVRRTERAPFQALSTQQRDTFLTGVTRDLATAERRARIIASMSQVIERPGLFIVEHARRQSLHGMPVIHREEFTRFTDPERILEIILERTRIEPEEPEA